MWFAINVWCAMHNNKLIGPMFYDGMLINARYLQLLKNIITDFAKKMQFFNLKYLRFEHYGSLPQKPSPVKEYCIK